MRTSEFLDSDLLKSKSTVIYQHFLKTHFQKFETWMKIMSGSHLLSRNQENILV